MRTRIKRILCVGNRLHAMDAAGPAVHDHLQRAAVPADVDVVDAGLGGLDLIRWMEGAHRVVIVDAVTGMAPPGDMVEWSARDVAALAGDTFDHAAGVSYALRALPWVCDGPIPPIRVIGISGAGSPATIAAAADRALALATQGWPTPVPGDEREPRTQ
jgi:hydrogenase maturation protease